MKKLRPIKRKQDLGKVSWESFYVILNPEGKILMDKNKEGKDSPMLFHKSLIDKALKEIPSGYTKLRADKILAHTIKRRKKNGNKKHK